MQAEARARVRQSPRFLWLYALAWAGGAIAYVPLLTILLPLQITAMAGDDSIRWLAYITFCGAVAASVGNILFGMLSDRSGSRRPWIASGLVLNVALLLAMPLAGSPDALLLLIVLWQLALNMMLGPLSAWAGDSVPPSQVGTLGGLLAFAPAMGALAGVLATLPQVTGAQERIALVGLLVAACVAPVLLFGRPCPMAPAGEMAGGAAAPGRPGQRRAFGLMWVARLLVQIAEAALFAYLLIYFRSVAADMSEGAIARLFGLVLIAAVPIALTIGRWADRRDQPFLPLAVAALLSGTGLVILSSSSSLEPAIAGYILFGLATTVFLSLHSGQTLRVLPSPANRGRDLGIVNLTNTVPSLIMPWLTLGLVPGFGFSGLFVLLALLAFASAAILSLLARTYQKGPSNAFSNHRSS
ncbi:MAG TPA: MFS transporter [Sphingomicrobium sp.]|nr:MFS transporter [Sphingomicrobium sp.]